MQEADAAAGLIARAANRHLGKSDREAAGVLSAVQRHAHFLDSPRMTAVLGKSEFPFADLKHRNVSVSSFSLLIGFPWPQIRSVVGDLIKITDD